MVLGSVVVAPSIDVLPAPPVVGASVMLPAVGCSRPPLESFELEDARARVSVSARNRPGQALVGLRESRGVLVRSRQRERAAQV